MFALNAVKRWMDYMMQKTQLNEFLETLDSEERLSVFMSNDIFYETFSDERVQEVIWSAVVAGIIIETLKNKVK